MIKSFRDKRSAAFAAGERVKAFHGIERLCFTFSDGDAQDVEIVDYH